MDALSALSKDPVAGAAPERSQQQLQQAAEAAGYWGHLAFKRLPWRFIACFTWLLACLQLVSVTGPLRCASTAGHVAAGLYQGHAPSWLLPSSSYTAAAGGAGAGRVARVSEFAA